MRRILCLTSIVLTMTSLTAHAQDLPSFDQLPQVETYPDPLRMRDGTPIRTADQWREKRRPELLKLFAHYMYGEAPPPPAVGQMRVELIDIEPNFLQGKAIRKLIELHHTPGCDPLQVLLIIPKSSRPVPVFIGANFVGNQAIIDDPKIPITPYLVTSRLKGIVDGKATEESRGVRNDRWPVQTIIDRGYALATFHNGNIDPDRHDWNDGVHKHYYKDGQTQPGKHEWGTIAAWAWGMQRVADYLENDPAIDYRRRMIAYGHSRMGKTALYAAATDERFALAIPHQAGCGGPSPNRNKNPDAEKVDRINRVFPHWFADAFVPFGDDVNRLPFDQHELIALMAPRPVLLSNAQEDQWADPPGQFEMLKLAEPVYRLLRAGEMESHQIPANGVLMNSPLGYFIREGKHTVTAEDWQAFLDFADKQLN